MLKGESLGGLNRRALAQRALQLGLQTQWHPLSLDPSTIDIGSPGDLLVR